MLRSWHPAASGLIADLWAMERSRLTSLFSTIGEAMTSPLGAMGAGHIRCDSGGYAMSGSTATIPVGGVILRKVPEFFSFFGIEATSTEEIDALIRMAMADDQVTDIRLNINSPGGTIAGVDELAATIRKARDTKPIKAVVQDLAASAAYWIASQATEIEASRTSFIGSIGVYRARFT